MGTIGYTIVDISSHPPRFHPSHNLLFESYSKALAQMDALSNGKHSVELAVAEILVEPAYEYDSTFLVYRKWHFHRAPSGVGGGTTSPDG